MNYWEIKDNVLNFFKAHAKSEDDFQHVVKLIEILLDEAERATQKEATYDNYDLGFEKGFSAGKEIGYSHGFIAADIYFQTTKEPKCKDGK